MKGMCKIVDYSIRDESLHVEGMTKVFRTLIKENLDNNIVEQILSELISEKLIEMEIATLRRDQELEELRFKWKLDSLRKGDGSN